MSRPVKGCWKTLCEYQQVEAGLPDPCAPYAFVSYIFAASEQYQASPRNAVCQKKVVVNNYARPHPPSASMARAY